MEFKNGKKRKYGPMKTGVHRACKIPTKFSALRSLLIWAMLQHMLEFY
jgi:hypothetical protein